ncbi:hypothetical protein ccbrp13_61310 [Ktedonobacteria bacterium brp13]|nr:hypothetical protein ccbrp13_61310 [Ktedonobacteria bacterium brp13]
MHILMDTLIISSAVIVFFCCLPILFVIAITIMGVWKYLKTSSSQNLTDQGLRAYVECWRPILNVIVTLSPITWLIALVKMLQ